MAKKIEPLREIDSVKWKALALSKLSTRKENSGSKNLIKVLNKEQKAKIKELRYDRHSMMGNSNAKSQDDDPTVMAIYLFHKINQSPISFDPEGKTKKSKPWDRDAGPGNDYTGASNTLGLGN